VKGKSPVRNTLVTQVGELTADGVLLKGLVLAPGQGKTDLAVVVGHGFTHHVGKPATQRVLHWLAARHTVVALDFRGHGRSGGRSSVGVKEHIDLAAGVRLARRLGHDRVATLGFSMGAAVALLHAAASAGIPESPDAVVAVSSPSRWWIRQTEPMRRLHWLLEQPHGRLLAPALGVRLDRPWADIPTSPIEVVQRIAPTPLLIIHGDRDHYFPVEHAQALHRAAGGDARLWVRPGMGHAETGTTPALIDEIADWLTSNALRVPTGESASGRAA
jgi:uncharacterized protein